MCSAAFISSGVSSCSEVAFAARLPSNCCKFSRVLGSVSPISFCKSSGAAVPGLVCTWPKRVSSRMAWITSASCKGTTPPVQAGAAPAAAPVVAMATPDPIGTLGTLPKGTVIVPGAACPPPPALAPSAAAINCNNFCGSFNHCLNSGPRVCAAIWAATLTSPVSGSAAINFTSLILMVLFGLPAPSASLICLAKSCALEPAIVKARTRRVKSSTVTSLEKCRLANPAVFNSCVKLRSACPASSGIPSSRSLLSETPNRNPLSPAVGRPCCSSFHVIWNCASVRL